MSKLQIAAVSLLLYSAQAAYPTTYPFENESYNPGAPRSSEPSHTFDDADVGGYVYTYAYSLETITDDMLPMALIGTTGALVNYQFFFGMGSDTLPASWFNCSGWGLIITSDTYISEIAGNRMCDPDNCCEMAHGQTTFWDSVPETGEYERESDAYDLGQCTTPYFEELFCGLLDQGHSAGWCINYMLTVDTRTIMYPCYDSVARYYMDCPLYKLSGFIYNEAVEPEQYFTSSTVNEQIAHAAVYRKSDKICSPYSYYFPESAASSESSETSAESADNSSESADSAAPALVSAVVLACLLIVS